MSEVWKLVIGSAGVAIGFLAGLIGFFAVMSSPSGALLGERPTLSFLVSIGMCGGGAALVGYLCLTIVGFMEQRAKRAIRKQKKRRRK